MSRLARWALRLVAILSMLGAVAALAAWARVRNELPAFGPMQLPGLSQPVAAEFDARGIPTVRAASLLDGIRAEGYLVARDRMFELEIQRRVGAGTLSELVGEKALPLDKTHRLYGFRQVADQAVSLLPPAERADLEAYAAGVNQFLETHRGRVGVEFDLLRLDPAPWTPGDSLLVLLVMHESLSSSYKDELFAEAISGLPLAEQRFLMPAVTAEDVLVIPDAEPKPPPEAAQFFLAQHALRDPPAAPARALDGPADLPAWAGATPSGIGSNNWVIAPSRSKSGKAMLANDPHLPLMEPGFWYPIRFEVGPRTIQGVALAGLPGIVIGQTDRVAWGFTNLFTDVQDLYREAATSERVESIPVKGSPAVEYRVPIGQHGPQVRPGLSLAWVALDPHHLRLPIESLMTVVDWPTFNQAIDDFLGPAQSVVYADIDGHIGWRAAGLLPIRRPGDDGSRIHDGQDPNEDWRGFVPMSEMPRVLDPPSGYIATANQRVIGTSFPHPVSRRWVAPNRARRISERIEAAGKLDRDGIESIQLDVVSDFRRELMQLLAGQVPSLGSFAAWDGEARADSEPWLVAHAWEVALHQELLHRVLGDTEVAKEFRWFNDESTLTAMLRADAEAWARVGLGDKAAFLKGAEARVEAALKSAPGRTWGESNRLTIHHPFGRAGGVLAALFDPPGFPQSGDSDTVRATGHEFGQSMRFIVDWGDPDATTLVIPLGESGHLGSPHRIDQQELWRQGDSGGKRTRLKQAPVGEGITFSP